MNMTRETVVNSAVLALLVLVPVVAQFRGDPFAITLATKVAIFALVTVAIGFLLWSDFYWIGAILTAWCAYFFRDPERVTPQDDDLVISPADGRGHFTPQGQINGRAVQFMVDTDKVAQPASLEKLLQRLDDQEFDLVAVGRALLVDAQWAAKVREGREQDILPFSREALTSLA